MTNIIADMTDDELRYHIHRIERTIPKFEGYSIVEVRRLRAELFSLHDEKVKRNHIADAIWLQQKACECFNRVPDDWLSPAAKASEIRYNKWKASHLYRVARARMGIADDDQTHA